MTPTPARHAKQGSYLANLGFASKHLGQIGRSQHLVMNSSESSTFGGNDEEHARHRVVLRSNMLRGGGCVRRNWRRWDVMSIAPARFSGMIDNGIHQSSLQNRSLHYKLQHIRVPDSEHGKNASFSTPSSKNYNSKFIVQPAVKTQESILLVQLVHPACSFFSKQTRKIEPKEKHQEITRQGSGEIEG